MQNTKKIQALVAPDREQVHVKSDQPRILPGGRTYSFTHVGGGPAFVILDGEAFPLKAKGSPGALFPTDTDITLVSSSSAQVVVESLELD